MIQKFISKLSEKEKRLTYATVVVILVVLLDRLFLGPVTSRLSSLDEEIKHQEESIRRDLRFLSYKNRILEENRVLKRYYTRKKLTKEETIALFLKRIEGLAAQAQINLIKVTPSEGEQKKGFVEYSASLDALGKLKDVITFMHLVDTSDDFLRVLKVNINAKKASSEDINVSLTITKTIIEDYSGDLEAAGDSQADAATPAELPGTGSPESINPAVLPASAGEIPPGRNNSPSRESSPQAATGQEAGHAAQN